MILQIDHVQIAAPKGCEEAAREFYGGILGMREIEKPATLRGRGGCWFQCGEQQLHVGVEAEFRAAKKAHPAFAVNDLEALRRSLAARGVKITEDDAVPGVGRFYAEDPWGNRLEFLEAKK
jgi:catechol 2,3-dioxygenase-like lactoylglutathione lyase family enzyme